MVYHNTLIASRFLITATVRLVRDFFSACINECKKTINVLETNVKG